MKNYEVKYATKEFANKKVKISNKRLAYLVPNMFGKLKNGFFKKVSSIIAVYQEEMEPKAPIVEETPVVQEPIVENKEVVQAVINEQPKQETPSPEVSSPKVEAPVNDDKIYIAKAYLADIESLSRKPKRSVAAPKKLLISKVFVQKLIANRMKAIETVNKKKEEELVLQEQPSAVDLQQEAALKYIALNEKLQELVKTADEVKSQMITLAKEHGLTRTMVENAMAKAK